MRFRHIPKVELHCHLDGIVDPAMLREIQRRGVSLPLTPETLQAAYPVRNFEEFIRWFQTADAVEGDPERFKPILAAHIARLIAQNVIYTEIMMGTSELPRDDGKLIEEFGEFREYVTGLEGGKIQVEFLVAVARNRPPETFEKLADRVIRLRAANLVFGIALAGWPEVPIKPLSRTLARLREPGWASRFTRASGPGRSRCGMRWRTDSPIASATGWHSFRTPGWSSGSRETASTSRCA